MGDFGISARQVEGREKGKPTVSPRCQFDRVVSSRRRRLKPRPFPVQCGMQRPAGGSLAIPPAAAELSSYVALVQ